MPAIDPYPTKIDNLGPARFAASVTPSDTVDLAYVTRGIMVGTDGIVMTNFSGGGSSVPLPLTVGTLYPFALSRVLAAGTTATGIVVIW